MSVFIIESVDINRSWTSDIWCCADGHGIAKSSTLSGARLIVTKLSEHWQIPLSDYRIIEKSHYTGEVVDIHYLDKDFFKKIFVTDPERELLLTVLQDWLDGLNTGCSNDPEKPYRGPTQAYSNDELETVKSLIENISENSVVFVKRYAK